MPIRVNDDIEIPDGELMFTASRSSGPGGQNVNKVSSRVTLGFNLAGSSVLSEAQKQKIASRLRSRVSKDGILQVSSQESRSQSANRERAVERLGELLRAALAERKKRRKTKPSKKAKEKRLEGKKKRGAIKRQRTQRDDA